MTVLNPFRRVDEHIMDDADLAGPLIFCFCFATFLLFVRSVATRPAPPPTYSTQSGKPQFGYIYGLALLGSTSLYCLLNLMSERGIDAYRVLSVLGYCLLPMVGVGALSVIITLECVTVPWLPLLSDMQFVAACWVTYFPPYQLSGVLMLHLVSSLPFCVCPINVFSLPTPSDFFMAALRCSAFSTWAAQSSSQYRLYLSSLACQCNEYSIC
jgi:protein YIPF5/7